MTNKKKLFKNLQKFYYLVYHEGFGWDVVSDDLSNKNLLHAVLRDIYGKSGYVYRFRYNNIEALDLQTDEYGLPQVSLRGKKTWNKLSKDDFEHIFEKIPLEYKI